MRSRAAKLLALPAAIFFWFVGWSLYWIGTRRVAAREAGDEDKDEEDASFLYLGGMPND